MTERVSHEDLTQLLCLEMPEEHAEVLLASLGPNLQHLMAAAVRRSLGQFSNFVGSWNIEHVITGNDHAIIELWRRDDWDEGKIHRREYRVPYTALWGDTAIEVLRREQDAAIDAAERAAHERKLAEELARREASDRATYERLKARFEPRPGDSG